MIATNKITIILAFSITVAMGFAFVFGRNYQKWISIHDQYALYMNLSGDHINEINEILINLNSEKAKVTLYNVNQSMINDFGCSLWIHHAEYMDDYNIEIFKAAMQTALDNSGSIKNIDKECLNNLKKYKILE